MQIFNTQISKSTKFSMKVANFYKMLNSEHRRLLSIWEDEDAEQIIRDLGTDAKSLLDFSTAIQTILKTANPDYEIIRPYKNVITQQEVTDEDGNVQTIETQNKVFLNPTFNSDGSLDELVIVD